MQLVTPDGVMLDGVDFVSGSKITSLVGGTWTLTGKTPLTLDATGPLSSPGGNTFQVAGNLNLASPSPTIVANGHGMLVVGSSSGSHVSVSGGTMVLKGAGDVILDGAFTQTAPTAIASEIAILNLFPDSQLSGGFSATAGIVNMGSSTGFGAPSATA